MGPGPYKDHANIRFPVKLIDDSPDHLQISGSYRRANPADVEQRTFLMALEGILADIHHAGKVFNLAGTRSDRAVCQVFIPNNDQRRLPHHIINLFSKH